MGRGIQSLVQSMCTGGSTAVRQCISSSAAARRRDGAVGWGCLAVSMMCLGNKG